MKVKCSQSLFWHWHLLPNRQLEHHLLASHVFIFKQLSTKQKGLMAGSTLWCKFQCSFKNGDCICILGRLQFLYANSLGIYLLASYVFIFKQLSTKQKGLMTGSLLWCECQCSFKNVDCIFNFGHLQAPTIPVR